MYDVIDFTEWNMVFHFYYYHDKLIDFRDIYFQSNKKKKKSIEQL